MRTIFPTIAAMVFSGSDVTGNCVRERKLSFRSTTATVACFGRMSATSITRLSFSPPLWDHGRVEDASLCLPGPNAPQ